MSSKLHPSERTALVIFIVLFASTLIEAWVYRALWVVGLGIYALVWLCALIFAVVYLGDALRDPALEGGRRARAIASIPLAITIVIASVCLNIGRRVEASTYLLFHSDQIEAAQRDAGPGRPAAIKFVEGIPDGGLAIIRSKTKPTELSDREQFRLTNEDIKACSRIVPDAWLCGYD